MSFSRHRNQKATREIALVNKELTRATFKGKASASSQSPIRKGAMSIIKGPGLKGQQGGYREDREMQMHRACPRSAGEKAVAAEKGCRALCASPAHFTVRFGGFPP